MCEIIYVILLHRHILCSQNQHAFPLISSGFPFTDCRLCNHLIIIIILFYVIVIGHCTCLNGTNVKSLAVCDYWWYLIKALWWKEGNFADLTTGTGDLWTEELLTEASVLISTVTLSEALNPRMLHTAAMQLERGKLVWTNKNLLNDR